MKYLKIVVSVTVFILFVSLFLYPTVLAQDEPDRLIYPISGDPFSNLDKFVEATLYYSHGNQLTILIVQIDPVVSTGSANGQAINNLDALMQQLSDICDDKLPPGKNCLLNLEIINSRDKADNPAIPEIFASDLTAILLLVDRVDFAMEIIKETRFEEELRHAYNQGVLISSIGIGSNMFSKTALIGYNDGFSAENALDFGAANTLDENNYRGLSFGVKEAIIDQKFIENNRVGLLLNAISLPDVPHLGIGIDSYTGLLFNNTIIDEVVGSYSVSIFDAETYQAANGVQYIGQRNTLSLRNVLVHMLSAGKNGYDISTLGYPTSGPRPKIERNYDGLNLPPGSGTIIIGGNLSKSTRNNVIPRFVNMCGGKDANILIIAFGFPIDRVASVTANEYAQGLGVPSQIEIITNGDAQRIEIPEDVTGIVLIAKDQSLIDPGDLINVKTSWLNGTHIFTDDAASALIGAYYSAHGPTPVDPVNAEAAKQESFIMGNTIIQPGLGLININIEPQVINDNRWGRLYSLAYEHPELITLGINVDTAIAVTQSGAAVSGDNTAIVLDLRSAQLDVGGNNGFVIYNGLLDVFAAGEMLVPQIAISDHELIHASTPVIPASTNTSTPTLPPTATYTSTSTPAPPTETLRPRPPTRTPRPTSTPPAIPPPTDPNLTAAIIVVGLFSVIVVFIGVWINRRHIL